MAYNIKYKGNFDNLAGEDFELQIWVKDYSGSVTEIIMGGAPAIHSYRFEDSEYFRGIQPSKLIFQVVNVTLSNLLSPDQQAVKVVLLKGAQVKFSGFVDVASSSESIAEGNKIITYTATDGLGLLKNKAFNKSDFGIESTVPVTKLVAVNRITNSVTVSNWQPDGKYIEVGNKIKFYSIDSPPGDFSGVFTITDVSQSPTDVYLKLAEPIPGTFPLYLTEIYVYFTYQERARLTIKICLLISLFGLSELVSEVDIYSGLENDNSEDFIDSMVEGLSFQNSGNWDSCYDVLKYIVEGMNAVCFQQDGRIVIKRVYETTLTHFKRYPITFGSATTIPYLFTNIAASPIMGVERSYLYPIRAVQFDKKAEAIQNPYNFKLAYLGNLAFTEIANTAGEQYTRYFYQATGTTADYIIVEKDDSGAEVSRWIQSASDWQFEKYDVTRGDSLSMSFRIKLPYGLEFDSGSNYRVTILLVDFNGNKYRWSSVLNRWVAQTDVLFYYTAFLQSDIQGNEVSISGDLAEFPVDGELTFEFGSFTLPFLPGSEQMHFYDFNFDYKISDIKSIAGTTSVISENLVTETIDATLSDYPDYQLEGAVLVAYPSGTTPAGSFNDSYYNSKKLFDLFGSEIMQHRKEFREQLEGEFITTAEAGEPIRMSYTYYYPTDFEIDYRLGKMAGMLVELIKFNQQKEQTYFTSENKR